MISDLKYALRQLIKKPGFTVFVVLTLALGIGANTAIFSIIDSVMLSSLPVKDPQRLVFLTNPDYHNPFTGSAAGSNRNALTYPEYRYLLEHNAVFSGILAAGDFSPRLVTKVGDPAVANDELVSLVSGDYFSVLGVNPLLGQVFTADVDKTRDANPVAVISYQYWQNQLNGRPDVLGTKIRVRDAIFNVIGVAPRGFLGETVGSAPAIWVPLSMQAEILPGRDWLSTEKNPNQKTMWLQAIGRLKPGVSIAQATASMNVAFQQYLESQIGAVPEAGRKNFLHQPLVLVDGRHGASTLRVGFSEPLSLLMVLVGLLLLIACANVANLLLARATFRQKEIAVRLAIGARPGRIFRQLLIESVLLSVLGGSIGLMIAPWGDAILLQLVGQNLPLHPNVPVLIFTFGISILAGVIFGTAPALQATRLDLLAVLKGTMGDAPRVRRFSISNVLVVLQVALSLSLLMVAGLFVHSFQKLATADLGYDHDHLLLFHAGGYGSGYKGAALVPFYEKLSDRIRVLPGVRGVAFSNNGFFSGDGALMISIEGYTPPTGRQMMANFDVIGPNYFSTLGIPVLLGREIVPQDAGNGQHIGLINRTMARYYFGDANPIGRRILLLRGGVRSDDFVVVGVVADAKYNSIRQTTPRRFYLSFYTTAGGASDATFEVRAIGEPSTVIAGIRAAVMQATPNVPPVAIQTMNEAVDHTLGVDHLLTKLSGFFGLLAALLASMGIYGVMSYTVARRTREIGIRTALGAQHGNILWLILSESLLLTLIGVLIGGTGSLFAGKLIGSLLFGLPPVDGAVLGAAIALMLVVGALGGYIPGRRAARVDPLVALRAE